MAIRTLKLFVVGPHNPERYKSIRAYIARMVSGLPNADDLDVSVVTPEQNPCSDRFNDWIFAQVDTCDMLVADMTGFNPNVIYEVAFAHSLGIPCAYLRSPSSEEDAVTDIKHYFKFTLMPEVTELQLSEGQNTDFDNQLSALFEGRPESGETILSDYYGGVSPVDAEFVRGLAEGYWRNFLKKILQYEPSDEYKRHALRILIPDTFERPDADVKRAAKKKLGEEESSLASNSLGRSIPLGNANKGDGPFFFDIPTTLLTITKSSKYVKVGRADYFDAKDRDRLTDRMARRFAAALWQLIRENPEDINWPLEQFEILWLSQVIGPWTPDAELMNSGVIERLDGL